MTRSIRALTGSILFFLSLAPNARAASLRHAREGDPDAVVSGPVAARIDTFMTAAAAFGMGGTLLVERDGNVILHKGYGVSNRQTHALATTHTPYILGSLSKQFTATAIYKLESQGKLHTSDSLGQWYPEAPADKRGITIDQLLHHTSGLPYLNRGDMYDSISVDSMVHETFMYPLQFAAGTRYAYSSPGYDLLGAIVARASGRTFDAYVRSEILDPAGMTETGFIDETARWTGEKRTPGYSSADLDPDPPLYPTPLAPKLMGSGGVVSTCGDLWKWELALRTNRVLDADATKKLFAPGPVASPTTRYAGGWFVVQSQRSTNVILHMGDLGGFNTDMRRFVDEHATIILLSNTREGGRSYREVIPINVTKILFGPAPVMPSAPAHIAQAKLDRWNGTVSLGPGVPAQGRVHGSAVWLTARTQDAMFALEGADSSARAQALRFNQRADLATGMLIGGDWSGMDSLFSPALVESSHPEFFRVWKAVSDSIGGVTGHEVLGSTISPPSGARTFVRLQGARGTRVMSLDWLAGGLVQSGPLAAEGLELPFYPESDTILSRYDLWAGRIVRVARSG